MLVLGYSKFYQTCSFGSFDAGEKNATKRCGHMLVESMLWVFSGDRHGCTPIPTYPVMGHPYINPIAIVGIYG